MNGYRITEARQDDLAAIVDIYNSTIDSRLATADLSPATVESRQSWLDAHGGNRPLYVLKNQEGELLAWGGFSDYYPREALPHHRRNQHLRPPRHARSRRRLKSSSATCWKKPPSLDIKNIIAVIFGHNHASIRLFHTFGFQEWGRLPQVCDLETMQADIVLLGKKTIN